jgi:hypothetical protein
MEAINKPSCSAANIWACSLVEKKSDLGLLPRRTHELDLKVELKTTYVE